MLFCLRFWAFFNSKMHLRKREELHFPILSLTTEFIGAIYRLFSPFKFHQIMNNVF